MTGANDTFKPSTVTRSELAKRLKVTGDALPAGWVAERLPRPALPIDECISGLVLKRRIRSPADLRALHPLGACPYALARSAVLLAAGHARIRQSIEDEIRPEVSAAAMYFKDKGRWLRAVVYGAERKAQILVDGLDALELDLPHREDLLEALSRSRELLENSTRKFVALHKQVSSTAGTCGV
jgi:hypothetical protein